jgi:hypothetical protein
MKFLFLILTLLGLITYGDPQRARTAPSPSTHSGAVTPADIVTISEDGSPQPRR